MTDAGVITPTATAKRAAKAGVQWREVLWVLQDDETRSYALSRFKASGFDAETFGRKREAREAIADGLTAAEDRLEYRELDRGRGYVDAHRQRLAIRDVRRRLEVELWP